MPRAKRLGLPGVAQHVIQRGNDRQPCFFREMVDYVRYLQDLREAALRFGCRIHAYVLMTNHVHLLLTPPETGAISRMMQTVGRRYVRYLNDALARTGTLWEGPEWRPRRRAPGGLARPWQRKRGQGSSVGEGWGAVCARW